MEQTYAHRPVIVSAIVVGVLAIATALFGLFYNAVSALAALRGAFDEIPGQEKIPYFYPAFFIMSGICVLCYVTLLVCGIDLVRSRLRWWRLAAAVLVFEVAYFFITGALWLDPSIGRSVAAATGVATGGMMAQFIILLPFWAPLLLWWASYRQRLKLTARPEATAAR